MQNTVSEVLYLPGSIATISSRQGLGRWLCVPLFRVVCLFQVFNNCLRASPILCISNLTCKVEAESVHEYLKQALCQCILLGKVLKYITISTSIRGRYEFQCCSGEVIQYVLLSYKETNGIKIGLPGRKILPVTLTLYKDFISTSAA